MEMTLRRLGYSGTKSFLTGISLPVGSLALIAMMVLPLPPVLLDLFFVTNILFSLLILMIAVNTFRPLDFSSFPSVLLIATVLRLGLNVASTRVVLSEGHTGTDAAGNVIEAFGEFVISGNYAVGLFVFIILIIINLVVITRGAGRVSEVSARFTLPTSMPAYSPTRKPQNDAKTFLPKPISTVPWTVLQNLLKVTPSPLFSFLPSMLSAD